MTEISVERGDVLTTNCDVLVLKYAQAFHGTDLAVARALGLSERTDDALSPGKFMRILSNGALPCKRVLFVGVPLLWDLRYREIRTFARQALTILSEQDCERDLIAMTVHGVGYGLDEGEAFTAQIAGLLEYLLMPNIAWHPSSIRIIERDINRAERLKVMLDSILSKSAVNTGGLRDSVARQSIPSAGLDSEAKRHVFVAMPFDEAMEDVYEFGIREPINTTGCLCERSDRAAFTGDVLERVKRRIASATLMVAELTGANANVYLEVGYAWGKEIPTLLLARKGEDLKFDVKSHNCVYYSNISHLRKQMSQLLPELTGSASSSRSSH